MPSELVAANGLKITEIFYSLQGEARDVGRPTVFIRLTGCPLRCQYCDSEYAFHGGERISIADILEQVAQYKTECITVTGGEPLAQAGCHELLKKLCDKNYEVSLETSGAIDVSTVDSRVVRVVDVKTPGSKEVDKNIYENFQYLTTNDQIKFVVCHREDYEWTKKIIQQHSLTEVCEILLSASYEELPPQQLADWIIVDQLIGVRLQVQLHKLLWGDIAGK
jgi:7-carboxy-7-deazaguanine synthase